MNVLVQPKSTKPTFTDTEGDQVVRYVRQERPSHLLFKIESFSLLNDALVSTGKTNIEATEFSAGNYTWILSIYPEGNAKYKGDNHISAYLKLKSNDTVTATFRFFLYDQLQRNFLTIEDLRVRRFDSVRKEWGISKLLPLSTFNDPSKGFLYDDCCIFGVEVFVTGNYTPNSATFSMLKGFQNCSHSWKIPLKFSNEISSPAFTLEGYTWSFCIFLKGHDRKQGLFLSLCLDSSAEFTGGRALYCEFELSLTDHLNGAGGIEWKENAKTWYSSSSDRWTMSLPALSFIYKNFSNTISRVTLELKFKNVFKQC